MAMPISVARYTVEDLEQFPNDGNRYELVDGVLLVTPAPGPPHQVVATRLVVTLQRFLEGRADVYVAAPGEVVLRPNYLLDPDVLVWRTDSLAKKWDSFERWLAIEIASPSTQVYDRDTKVPVYLALGVSDVWRVDLGERCVFRSSVAEPVQRYGDRLVWHPPLGTDSLTIELAAIFRDLPE